MELQVIQNKIYQIRGQRGKGIENPRFKGADCKSAPAAVCRGGPVWPPFLPTVTKVMKV